jgi:hypothetical protein
MVEGEGHQLVETVDGEETGLGGTDDNSVGYSASPVAGDLHLDDEDCSQEVADSPFRALDLLGTPAVFRREIGREPSVEAVPDTSAFNLYDLFGGDSAAPFLPECECEESDREWTHVTEPSVQSQRGVELPVEVESDDVAASGPVVNSLTWNQLVASNFSQFRELPSELKFPWEIGTLASVFNYDADPLPRCPGLAEALQPSMSESSRGSQSKFAPFALPEEAQYVRAVKSMRDLSYFEDKNQKLELACCRPHAWMEHFVHGL